MQCLRHLLFLIGLTMLASICQAADSVAPKTLVVGLMPYLNTRTLLTTYQPVAEALEAELKQPVTLLTAPDFDTFVKRVTEGEFDLVLLAPHYARLAEKDYGYLPLLVHKSPIRAVLLTARDMPLKRLDDLRGQSIAVVDRSALIVISAAMAFADEGLKEGRDYQFVETVSHSRALHNAITGKSRAALVSYSTLILAPADLQRDAIIFRDISQIPGQFFIAHNRLRNEQQKAIKTALLNFAASPQGLAFFDKTKHGGYREPNREDAAFLDKMLPETRRQLSGIIH